MSENSHDYQASAADVPVEQVSTQDVSTAFDEKLFTDQKELHQESGDIEKQELADLQEAPEEEAKESDEFSSKFAALSRKEKAIRDRERQVELKIREFEEKMQSFQQPEEEEPTEKEPPLEYRLRKDPIKTLESLGLSYKDLTDIVLNDGDLPQDMRMKLMREELESDYKTRFEQLEQKLLDKEKAEEEANYNQTISNFKNDINEFVNGSEEYELIQANDAYDLVYDVIESHYEESGRILETENAAAQVEQYLEEELKKVLKKSKKIGSWRPEATKRVAETPSRQSPTLSNSLSAEGASKAAAPELSREQSLHNAASLIRWED